MSISKLNLTVKDNDVVPITYDLYVKTPEAMRRVSKELRKKGYYIIKPPKENRRVVHAALRWYRAIWNDWKGYEIPDWISVYETWGWAPLPKSPTLHNKLLSAIHEDSDVGFYAGSHISFSSRHWVEMAKFIRHFTELDADAFDRAWPRFRKPAVDAIRDLAYFCHENPSITTNPNILATLGTAVNVLNGRQISEAELEAGMKGIEDPNRETFSEALRKSAVNKQ